MNGLSVYQIKVGMAAEPVPRRARLARNPDRLVALQVHRKYTGEDFDEDLRTVLRRSGCKNEKIAFIMDESNVLDSGFLERMNTLLANGEVTAWQAAWGLVSPRRRAEGAGSHRVGRFPRFPGSLRGTSMPP